MIVPGWLLRATCSVSGCMVALPVVALALLAACAPPLQEDSAQRMANGGLVLPPMARFEAAQAQPPRRANIEIAHDIMELGFMMESGRPIPQFSRFEGPVTLRLTGNVPVDAVSETTALLRRLRDEAGITLFPAPDGETAAITVEFLPRSRMQAQVPAAACFIVPRISSWAEFLTYQRDARLDWTTLAEREHVAVFVPYDVPVQEMRDCLHEEIAQAMGPINDLYRLHDSVFNDDNFQTVLTGFDMLVLRVWYDPDLQSGMTPQQVAGLLPAILARLNPAGERVAPRPLPAPTRRDWIDAIETALAPGVTQGQRRRAAARALAIAQQEGWQDARAGFSHFTHARLSRPTEGRQALEGFQNASRIFRALPGGEAHAAHADMQLAAFALSQGQFEQALSLSGRARPAAVATQNAALLSLLMMVESHALQGLGQSAQGQVVLLDSLGWARYGFGAPERVMERLEEVSALSPATGAQAPQSGAGS